MEKANNAKDISVKVSFEQVRLFRLNAIEYIKQFPEETKFKYALEKVFERTSYIESKWVEKLADVELDNAATDEKGIVLFTIEEKGKRVYSFTKEGLKKRDADVNREFKKPGTNEFIPFYTEDIPKGLHESWTEVFTPFVIKSIEVKILDKKIA